MKQRIWKFLFPANEEIQGNIFNLLAMGGFIVCIVTAFYNLALGLGVWNFLVTLSGAVYSVSMMVYVRKTRKYRGALILTVITIFLGLYTYLFFLSGGYHSGMPSFFIFAVVFTAFMLDGPIMPVLVFVELLWYAIICLYAYYNPLPDNIMNDEGAYLIDVIVSEIMVSCILAITMYLQIQVYKQKQTELDRTRQQAEKANMAKSDFLAKMSHDIRTPLNTMLATNELILQNTSSREIREWVNDSNNCGQILLTMINDMLDISRIEAGKSEHLKKPYGTEILFDEICRAWGIQAERAGLDFIYQKNSDIPPELIGDERAVWKILDNLLSNAVKYTPEGYIEVKIDFVEKIGPKGGPQSGELLISVEDSGIGIAPEYRESIFRPFERGSEEAFRDVEGSGLGLAIVKDLVEGAGGDISFESSPGQGTTFMVRLPQLMKSSKGEKREEKEEYKGKKGQMALMAPNARILVVDDNHYNRKVICRLLEPTLVQTDDVESGYEAVEMIDVKHYDLVFMDLRMPGMDGVETLKEIRMEYPDFHTPVIALTGDIRDGVEEMLLNQGFDGFASKPVSSYRLYELIRTYIPDKTMTVDMGEKDGDDMKIDALRDKLLPYGIDLRAGLDFSAGDEAELLMKLRLFEGYGDEAISRLQKEEREILNGQLAHSIKSAARGIGARFLSELSEAVEIRKDAAFSREALPILIHEYQRVLKGIREAGIV
ncbi:MAG: response regulator [Lachnospiraceae bacterium]|nr:response regulator [Lachnospiraceae bacterium]